MAKIRGIGIDAVAIARMASHRMSAHVINRLFHPMEAAQAMQMHEGRDEFLASRFAAKEALVKALGTGFIGIAPAQIAVYTDEKGKPSFLLSDAVKRKVGLEGAVIHLSLCHEEPLAIACVVLEEPDGTR